MSSIFHVIFHLVSGVFWRIQTELSLNGVRQGFIRSQPKGAFVDTNFVRAYFNKQNAFI